MALEKKVMVECRARAKQAGEKKGDSRKEHWIGQLALRAVWAHPEKAIKRTLGPEKPRKNQNQRQRQPSDSSWGARQSHAGKNERAMETYDGRMRPKNQRKDGTTRSGGGEKNF